MPDDLSPVLINC